MKIPDTAAATMLYYQFQLIKRSWKFSQAVVRSTLIAMPVQNVMQKAGPIGHIQQRLSVLLEGLMSCVVAVTSTSHMTGSTSCMR